MPREPEQPWTSFMAASTLLLRLAPSLWTWERAGVSVATSNGLDRIASGNLPVRRTEERRGLFWFAHLRST